MYRRFGRRGILLVMTLLISGCHLSRPGEVRSEAIAACDPQRMAYLEGRFEQLSEAERELLAYCRTAQAAQALSATQEHVDYLADLQFLGLVLGAVSAVLTVIVAAGS